MNRVTLDKKPDHPLLGRTTHLPAVKARAEDLATACRQFDDALRRLR